MIFKNSAGRRVTVPFHAGKILHPKILKSIITDADIAPEIFKLCSDSTYLAFVIARGARPAAIFNAPNE